MDNIFRRVVNYYRSTDSHLILSRSISIYYNKILNALQRCSYFWNNSFNTQFYALWYKYSRSRLLDVFEKYIRSI